MGEKLGKQEVIQYHLSGYATSFTNVLKLGKQKDAGNKSHHGAETGD